MPINESKEKFNPTRNSDLYRKSLDLMVIARNGDPLKLKKAVQDVELDISQGEGYKDGKKPGGKEGSDRRDLSLLAIGLVMSSLADYQEVGDRLVGRIREKSRKRDSLPLVRQTLQVMDVVLNQIKIFILSRHHTADFFLPVPLGDPLAEEIVRFHFGQIAKRQDSLLPNQDKKVSEEIEVSVVDLPKNRYCLFYGFNSRPNFQQKKGEVLEIAKLRCQE